MALKVKAGLTMMEERGEAGRPGLGLIESDYWLDRVDWSAYLAFLILGGLVLLIVLPADQRIAQISSENPPPEGLFPAAFVILYGIFAMALGGAEVEAWRGRLSWGGHLIHLLGRQLLALGLTLPYWLTFLRAHSFPSSAALGVFAHLLVYGYVLSLFGCRLALSRRSELFQFNLKYLLFISYLIGCFFVPGLRYLNPFWPLDKLLGKEGLPEGASFFLISYLLWAALGLLLALWIRRALREGGRADGLEIP